MKKQIILFSISNIFGAMLTMIGSFWAANLAGPTLMGAYNTLQLLVIYAPLLTLGVFNGLNRELPYSIGKGDYIKASRHVSVALYVCYVVGAVSFIALLLAACGALILNSSLWALGFAVFAFVIPLALLRLFTEVTYRTSQDFGWLSVVKLVSGALGVVLVPLLYIHPWGGLLIRALLVALIGILLLWIKRKFREKAIWDKMHAIQLFSVGFPIFIVGYIYILFINIDRFIIVTRMSLESIGHYTPALLILQGMAILPSSVAQVIYPRAAEKYGRENSLRTLLSLVFKPMLWLLLIQLPFVLIGLYYIDDLVLQFMPRFIQGIEAARWSILIGLVLSMSTPAIIFNVARQQRMYSACLILSVITVGVAWALQLRADLVGVSISMLCGSICFTMLSAAGAWYLCKKNIHN